MNSEFRTIAKSNEIKYRKCSKTCMCTKYHYTTSNSHIFSTPVITTNLKVKTQMKKKINDEKLHIK